MLSCGTDGVAGERVEVVQFCGVGWGSRVHYSWQLHVLVPGMLAADVDFGLACAVLRFAPPPCT